MSPKTTPDTPGEKPSHLKRALAFFTVAIIAAVAVHGLYAYNAADSARLDGGATESSGASPTLVLADLEDQLHAAESGADVDTDALAQQAWGEVDAASGHAESRALFLADHAKRNVVGATGGLELPPLPEDHVPGAPVTPYVGTARDVVYEAQGFGDVGLDELQAFEEAWKARALELAGENDEVRDQIEAAFDEAGSATGEPKDTVENDPVLAPVWSLLVSEYDMVRDTAPEPVGSTLPSDPTGSVGALDSMGSLDPAEEQAMQAYDHADALLGEAFRLVGTEWAGENVGAIGAYIAFVEQNQEGLVAIVEDTAAGMEDAVAEREAALRKEADDRVAEVQQTADRTVAKAQEDLDAYEAQVLEARTDAEAMLESGLEEHLPVIQQRADFYAEDLTRQAEALPRTADDAVLSIEAKADQARARLEGLAAQGHDVEAALAQVDRLQAEAEAEVRSQAQADADALLAEAEALKAHGAEETARVQTVVDAALADADERADAAVAEARARADFVQELAVAEAAEAVAAHEVAVQDAIADLQIAAQDHVQAVQEKALGINAQAATVLETTNATRADLLADVGYAVEGAPTLLGDDLEVIQQVAEDCGASQDHLCDEDWTQVLGQLEGLQGEAVNAGGFRLADLQKAEKTVADVQAELVALSLV